MNDAVDDHAVTAALTGLPECRSAGDALLTTFAAPTVAAALTLVTAIGDVAEEVDHHTKVDWRYDRVFVLTTSHDVGGITRRDVDLAGRISFLAGAVGAVGELGRARRGA